jgi:phosphatidate cytidylyltransferase
MADKQHEDEDALRSTPPAPASEGVRIIGADEAQTVLDSGKAAERIPVDEPRLGDVPEAPTAPRSPTASFPTPGGAPVRGTLFEESGEGPTWSAASDEEPTAAIPLPHWSEPPTGEVSIVFAGDDLEPIDTTDAASALRFRTDAGSWDDEETSLHEALVLEEEPAEELDVEAAAPLAVAAVESDDDFDAAVKARRGRRSAATPTVKSRRRRGPAALPGTPQVPAPAAPAPVPAPTPSGGALPGLPPQPQMPANLVLRVGVGVAIAVVCVVFFLIGTAATVALVSLITAIAAVEIYSGLRKQQAHPAALLGIVACAAMPIAAYNIGERAFPVVFVLLVAFSMFWYLFGVSKTRPVVGIAMTVFGFAYVGVLAGFAGLLLASPNGIGALIGVAACAIAYDVGGYLVGSMMGKTRITPHISPNKTLEGLVAGMAASVAAGVVIGVFGVEPWGFLGGVGLGVLCAVVAPLGDLCESMLKRDIGVKDFGDLLPGHGGILDRFDTILFCMPAAFYLLWYIVN